MENTTTHSVLRTKDLVIGTVITLVMGTVFTALSSGLSLIVTFVPGIVFTWLTFVWLYLKKTKLPSGSEFLPESTRSRQLCSATGTHDALVTDQTAAQTSIRAIRDVVHAVRSNIPLDKSH
jgi:hypothetical protein